MWVIIKSYIHKEPFLSEIDNDNRNVDKTI